MSGSSAAGGGHWLADALLKNWTTKAIALVLALVVFVMTRDEVTRTFQVQLDVQRDPDRVLRTQLPDAVEVEVRGPWARMAKLRPGDLGTATLKLRDAEPGPLNLDPALIVMPEGIVLADLVYERVDLRFEAIVERQLTVVASLTGEVHADYERVAHTVTPDRWRVRGPQGAVEALTELKTETVSINGATENLRERASLIRPEPGVVFVGSIEGPREPVVDVLVELRPRRGERELEISTREALAAAVAEREPLWQVLNVSQIEGVRIEGPLPSLRRIEGIARPIVPSVSLGKIYLPKGRNAFVGTVEAKIEMVWAPEVPEDVKALLDYDPARMRMDLRLGPVPQ